MKPRLMVDYCQAIFGLPNTGPRCSASLLSMIVTFILGLNVAAGANQPPMADAGPDRYAGAEPILLNGTGSYDPDPGDTLWYRWTQLSGPALVLSNADTATPTLEATPTDAIGVAELQLVVGDDELYDWDKVSITIVPAVPSSIELWFENHELYGEPFDLNKPTLVFFPGAAGDT